MLYIPKNQKRSKNYNVIGKSIDERINNDIPNLPSSYRKRWCNFNGMLAISIPIIIGLVMLITGVVYMFPEKYIKDTCIIQYYNENYTISSERYNLTKNVTHSLPGVNTSVNHSITCYYLPESGGISLTKPRYSSFAPPLITIGIMTVFIGPVGVLICIGP